MREWSVAFLVTVRNCLYILQDLASERIFLQESIKTSCRKTSFITKRDKLRDKLNPDRSRLCCQEWTEQRHLSYKSAFISINCGLEKLFSTERSLHEERFPVSKWTVQQRSGSVSLKNKKTPQHGVPRSSPIFKQKIFSKHWLAQQWNQLNLQPWETLRRMSREMLVKMQ